MITQPSLARRSALVLLGGSLLAVMNEAHALQFSISNLPGTEIVFTPIGGGRAEVSFTTDADGYSFRIDEVSDLSGGANGSSVGFLGKLLGTWNLGPTMTVSGPNPLIEAALVTSSSGTLEIEGMGTLSADVSFKLASSLKSGKASSVAGLGDIGNVTPIANSSTNPDLLEFFGTDSHVRSLGLTFPLPGKSLADLIAKGGHTTFAGTLSSQSVPDRASTGILLGFGLMSLLALQRRTTRGQ